LFLKGNAVTVRKRMDGKSEIEQEGDRNKNSITKIIITAREIF